MSSDKSKNRGFLFADVIARAKECLDVTTDKALAEAIGMSTQAFANRKNTESVPYEEIIAAAVIKNLSIEYIFTGKQIVDEIADQRPEYTKSEYAEIQHYNVQAAAGSGRLATEEETLKPLSFRRDWLAKRHLTPANLAIVSVSGDSMEPYLKDEDLVLVDRSQITITSGKTYVLRLDGHLLVKNLQLLPHGLVQVASFNPGCPPYQVNLSDESLDMAVIGRVVASMHEW